MLFFRYLLSNQPRKSVTDLMPMIGARFYTQLDAAQLRLDVLENELAKELENGRLFKLLVKLATINERPELNMEPTWAETGDRYMLKLFRDYVFHQVTTDGRPWLDLAHVVACLNKLDSGSQDKVNNDLDNYTHEINTKKIVTDMPHVSGRTKRSSSKLRRTATMPGNVVWRTGTICKGYCLRGCP